MTDLQKQLRHLLAFYGHPGIDLDQAVADVEGAYADAGSIDSTEMAEYIAEHSMNVHVHHDAFVGPDSVKCVGIDNIEPPDIEYDTPGQLFGNPIDVVEPKQTLEKKLDEILDDMGSSYYPGHEYPESYEPQNIEFRKEAAAQIKQAFIDAGWRDLSSRGGLLHATVVDHRGRVDYMTGQEWYTKFYEEMHSGENHIDDTKSYYIDYILSAAKKAAGIK